MYCTNLRKLDSMWKWVKYRLRVNRWSYLPKGTNCSVPVHCPWYSYNRKEVVIHCKVAWTKSQSVGVLFELDRWSDVLGISPPICSHSLEETSNYLTLSQLKANATLFSQIYTGTLLNGVLEFSQGSHCLFIEGSSTGERVNCLP